SVAITVTAVNDAPVAVGNCYTTNEDTILSVAAPGILGNDSDVDGTPLQAIRVTSPAHGTLSLSANGSFVYTPTENFNGVDTFTYRASDGLLSSAIETVTISVAAVNDAPIAVADSYSTDQNVSLNIPARGVLANDTDADGDTLIATVVTAPLHGTLTLAADGSFQYTPTAGYNGLDSFTYQASDSLASSAPTTVSLNIAPPPPPSAKFFVVDADRLNTYQYAASGSSITNTALNKSDSKPRGIASNSVGTIQWVVDLGGSVFVYDKSGTLLGQWTPQNVGKPEGITVWGNNLWIVDPTQDRVFYFANGANLRSGRVAPTSSFALNSGNLDSTDLVTDGIHMWVVNNTLTTDKVFRYSTAGVLEGSWNISATSPSPTGITLDPTNVNHMWIVDSSTDRVYQYDSATSRITGSQEPSTLFQLATTNTNAQGIADPLVALSSSSVQVSGAVSVNTYAAPVVALQATRAAVVDAMLSESSERVTGSRTESPARSMPMGDGRSAPTDRMLERLAVSRAGRRTDIKLLDNLFADFESVLASSSTDGGDQF
ncbi:MAG: tandem-95 repeat protein, partial [Pirellulaceae bacterium]|nr:tandem-95 repeat protein [Pirellulaceae bacterium]